MFERRFSDALAEFARTLLTDLPPQAILDRLVARVVDVLPVVAAGVTLIPPGDDPRYIAASDEWALGLERLQTEWGEGPCLVAYETGDPVAIEDLRGDHRFPGFATRAIEQGLLAVFAFPLRHGGVDHLGVLDLYRTSPGLLSPRAMEVAQTLADVASAYLLNARSHDDLRDASERAIEASLHDALTGSANRTLLCQRLDHAMLRCRRSQKMVAILFADLDRFKWINDSYGHHVGDELLVAVAERITGLLRPGDTLARVGGDEFVVLCEDLGDPSEAEPVAARIEAALAEEFVLSDTRLRVSASVGIAFAGRGDEVPEDVLQEADTAMYEAKQKGGARHGIVGPRDQRRVSQHARLNRDLSGAASRGELRAEYQPILTTSDGRITGVEALLRWMHPAQGLVSPDTILPLAERSGLISEIGRWILDRACRDLHRWRRHNGGDELKISINSSAHELMAPNFVGTVAAVLADTRTDPSLVTLELRERVLIEDKERACLVLNDLKRLGVMLALDDFGTGHSALYYLQQFPIDIVKLDRSFIAELGSGPNTRLVLNSTVGLAHGLKITVVVKGVESADQLEEAIAVGCDAYQGYYLAPPLSAKSFETLIARGEHPSNRLSLLFGITPILDLREHRQ